LRNPILLYF